MGKEISKEELVILLDARNKLCEFCENDVCDKCQITLLINDAYSACAEIGEEEEE